MIQVQLKLRPCKSQIAEMERYLYHLQAVWNWGVRKIELNAANKIYFGKEFKHLLAGHSVRLGIPSHTLQGLLDNVRISWDRCFKGLSRRPRLKGWRNRLNSIPFPDPFKTPNGGRIQIPGLGPVRFHRMHIPDGALKSGRLVKRASGWYLCLFIDAAPQPIDRVAEGVIGIDPGFKSLLTTSGGEIIEHPREFNAASQRLAQAQRGHGKRLTARLQERIRNRRKDRNHKLSRRLIAENTFIAWSADDHSKIARRFGKSVTDSGHYELRRMLAYKAPTSGATFVEVSNRFSTMTCSACGARNGPQGLSGLAVRQWRCGCGAEHDRDVNAARNTLLAGLGSSLGVQEPQESRKSRRDEMSKKESRNERT